MRSIGGGYSEAALYSSWKSLDYGSRPSIAKVRRIGARIYAAGETKERLFGALGMVVALFSP